MQLTIPPLPCLKDGWLRWQYWLMVDSVENGQNCFGDLSPNRSSLLPCTYQHSRWDSHPSIVSCILLRLPPDYEKRLHLTRYVETSCFNVSFLLSSCPSYVFLLFSWMRGISLFCAWLTAVVEAKNTVSPRGYLRRCPCLRVFPGKFRSSCR